MPENIIPMNNEDDFSEDDFQKRVMADDPVTPAQTLVTVRASDQLVVVVRILSTGRKFFQPGHLIRIYHLRSRAFFL